MTIDKTLTVDLNRVQPHKVIKIHEGDVNSVFLMLTVTKDGEAVSLSGLTIKYDATIAGFLAEQDANGSVSSGKIRIPITKNMTALPGTLKIDIKMKSGTEVLYTQTVTMIVDKSVVDDSTIIDFDGTTIGGRLNALEGGFLDVKTVVRQLNAKFPIEADDIADNQVIKVKSISNDDATVNASVENNTAYRVTLEGRSNLMICVNSGTNLRAQVRFDTLGYMKYRTQTKHDDVWDDWTAWSPIASSINIANSAVATAKLADYAVTTAKIASGAVTEEKLASNAVTSAKIGSKAVTSGKIANGAVSAINIQAGCITAEELAAGAVSSTELADGAITEAKLADNAVTTSKIKDSNISSQKLMNSVITTAKLVNGAVTTDKLGAESVTTTKLADGSVTRDKIAAGAVGSSQIGHNSIGSAHLTDGCVDTDAIDNSAVTSTELADGAVTLSKIPDEEITSDKLAPGAVTTAKIEFNAVTADEIANGAVTTNKIANGAVTAAKIASGVVPTKTSDLTNDSGFLTQHQDISGKADKATTLAGYGITNAYTKGEVDGTFMELAPDTIPSSIGTLEDGQLFRCQGSVALKTGNASDYIELAKKSIVPTKTSDLQNDSGFISDLSGCMKLAHTTTSEDAGQFYLERVGLSWSAVNLYLALYNSDPKRVAWYSDLPDISGKADIESGTVPSNHAWYTQEGDGYTMTGNYTIIGNMCFLRATAFLIQGWERVYYSLPVAATASGATLALHNDGTFTIATGTQSNISVLEIKQIGSQYMSTGGTISFTLVYKCG